MKLTKFQSQVASYIQQIRMAPGIPTAWLPVSYVMAHAQIESGFEPAVLAGDYASTGSVGLMQVTKATAEEVYRAYPQAFMQAPMKALDQAEPLTSLTTGMLYLRTCYNYLLPIFHSPLAYRHVCMAYNEGPGNAGKGVTDLSYYYKWYSAQQGFAYLDSEPMV